MRVWTIQTEGAWQVFQRTGVLRADSSRVDADFRRAYEWMTGEMRVRLGAPPSGCEYPVWVWQQWRDAAKPKPDLRATAHLPRGERGVLLTLAVDEREVLFSDFELWHYVLNGWHLPDRANRCLGSMTASWRRIFDLDWWAPEIAEPRERKSIQGVLWEARLDHVDRAQPFVAR